MTRVVPPRSSVCLAIACSDEVLRRLPQSDLTWLSDSERSRLQSLRAVARRDHYLAGHWLARELLAKAFVDSTRGTTIPQDWSLRDSKGQAPPVFGHDLVQLSISHSGAWVAAAVAQQPVGIDIEQRPRLLDRAIRDLLVNPDEAAGDIDNDDLLQRWVAKEAWLKARGESALPQQLRQLRMHASGNDVSDVICYRSDDFHFAVATSPMATLVWNGRAGAIPAAAFRVEHRPNS